MLGKYKKSKFRDYLILATVFIVLNIFNITCENLKKSGLIYILEWTPATAEPFTFLEKKQKAFVNRKCAFQNCYLTSNRSYFRDIREFDVILFNVAHISSVNITRLKQRSLSQKYIMVAMEPAGFYPVPAEFNDFFNFTWTYKLDSDVPFPYIVVKNQLGEVIGPKIDMQWMKGEMNDTSDNVYNIIKNKQIAAAWFASNCISYQRLNFVNVLNSELAKYGQRVDIYGKCGNYQCPKQSMLEECYELIKSDYYFYLAFENSFGADYVSEKLLHALQNFAVPVVLGGANYSRFMPEGIYLDALSLGPIELAIKMSKLITNTKKYLNFFKWHRYYTYHLTSDDSYHREVCGLCELLNNNVLMSQTTIVSNVSQWWNEESPVAITTKSNWGDSPDIELILDDEEDTNDNGIMSKLYNFLFAL